MPEVHYFCWQQLIKPRPLTAFNKEIINIEQSSAHWSDHPKQPGALQEDQMSTFGLKIRVHVTPLFKYMLQLTISKHQGDKNRNESALILVFRALRKQPNT